MDIVVYVKPDCSQCDATKKRLEYRKLAYRTVDLTTDDAARSYVTTLGYSSAPVVVAGNDHWAGFRIDRLDALAKMTPGLAGSDIGNGRLGT